ncbi:NAD-dependent protein deacylase [Gemmata sp. JC717]|uniref:protein acetyllysine N-acetyltransferase n=1 Tax=Gemmata algarum TaxID=2975278 RepID=A0ABU5ETB4_9BACT|nr:NAD-dependent protein deacylase [Gemmata algarum]MDY3556848.1 NAD-dependent protein deacylase [Gemmata algarum]MDY3557862.1 NAD-dependent protein deacylase [Gemmata algarum]
MDSLTPAGETLTLDDARGVERVVDLLRRSQSVLFITGAGLSADSGLPTYRGAGGLYDGCDPEDGVPIESLLSREALERRPDLTWKYLLQIERACRSAAPNRGHEVIAEAERAFERVWVLTQNVDGFHRRAGSRNVIDIHGDLYRVRCLRCPYAAPVADYSSFTVPPACPRCGGTLRPDVVLFGEHLPAAQLATYKREVERGFDLVFSIGTRSVFPYISAPVLDAYHLHRSSVEINPGETDVSEFVTVKLPLRAAPALDAIWRAYRG